MPQRSSNNNPDFFINGKLVSGDDIIHLLPHVQIRRESPAQMDTFCFSDLYFFCNRIHSLEDFKHNV